MNNVIKFEFKLKTKIMITISIILFIFYFMYVGLYPSFADSIDSFTTMVDSMPKAMIEMFNFDIQTFTTFSGYYVFILSIINIVFAVLGVKLAFVNFAVEKTNHLEEYLFVKPITRTKLFYSKTLSAFYTYLLISILLYVLSLGVITLIVDDVVYNEVLLLNLSPILIGIWMYSISSIIAIVIKKAKFHAPYLAAIVLSFFMLSFIIDASGDEIFNVLTPFSIYSPSLILSDGINGFLIIYTLLVVIVLNLVAMLIYSSWEVRS